MFTSAFVWLPAECRETRKNIQLDAVPEAVVDSNGQTLF
jgi:hypothetical protein